MNTAISFIALPLGAAFVLPLVGRRTAGFAIALMVLALTGALGVWMSMTATFPHGVILGGWLPPVGISLHVDRLSVLLVTLFSMLAFFALWFQMQQGQEKPVSFAVLVLVMTAASSGAVFTRDLFNLFVFLEIASVTAVALSAPHVGSPRGVLRYWLFGAVASVSMLLGIALIYASVGTLHLPDIGTAWPALPVSVRVLAGVLVMLGLFVKMEIMPFHAWAPSTYRMAPSSVGLLLSGVITSMGSFALWKFYTLVLQSGHGLPPVAGNFSFAQALMGMGMFTLAGAAFAMLAQTDVKKLLAFSTIAQMGLVLMGIALGNALAVRGFFFLLFAHALGKSLLFLVAGRLVAATRTSDMRSWQGAAQNHRSLVWFWFIGSAALIGLPLFAGFWGKFLVFGGALEMGRWGMAGVAVLIAATVMEAVALLRVGHTLWEGSREKADTPIRFRFSLAFWAAAVVLSAGILWMGLLPHGATRVFEETRLGMSGEPAGGGKIHRPYRDLRDIPQEEMEVVACGS